MASGRPSPYLLKTSPLGSHNLLLGLLPSSGAGRTVLDVGGGEGYLANELQRRGYAVTCVAKPGTVSASLLPIIRALEADLDFVLPQCGTLFDFAVLGDVLEHLREPGRVLRWVVSLLAPGGEIVASLPNGAHLYVRLRMMFGDLPQHDRGLFDRTHLHYYSWRGWQRLFQEAGMTAVLCGTTPVPLALALQTWLPSTVAMGSERAYQLIARLRRPLLAYQFVVRASPGHRAAGSR